MLGPLWADMRGGRPRCLDDAVGELEFSFDGGVVAVSGERMFNAFVHNPVGDGRTIGGGAQIQFDGFDGSINAQAGIADLGARDHHAKAVLAEVPGEDVFALRKDGVVLTEGFRLDADAPEEIARWEGVADVAGLERDAEAVGAASFGLDFKRRTDELGVARGREQMAFVAVDDGHVAVRARERCEG